MNEDKTSLKDQHKAAKDNREIINDPSTPELKSGRPPLDPTPLCYDPGPNPDVILQALSDYLLLRTDNPNLLALAAEGRRASLTAKGRGYSYITDDNRTRYEKEMIAGLVDAIEESILEDGWKIIANHDRFWWLTTSANKIAEVER